MITSRTIVYSLIIITTAPSVQSMDVVNVQANKITNLVSSTYANTPDQNLKQIITIHLNGGAIQGYEAREVCEREGKKLVYDDFDHDNEYRGMTQEDATKVVTNALETLKPFNSDLTISNLTEVNFTFKNISSLDQLKLVGGWIHDIILTLEGLLVIKCLKKNITITLVYNKSFDSALYASQRIVERYDNWQPSYGIMTKNDIPINNDREKTKTKTAFDSIFKSYEAKQAKREKKIRKLLDEMDDYALHFMRAEHLL